MSQNPPHSTAQWEKVGNLWQQAIAQLDRVTVDDPAYSDPDPSQMARNLQLIMNELEMVQSGSFCRSSRLT